MKRILRYSLFVIFIILFSFFKTNVSFATDYGSSCPGQCNVLGCSGGLTDAGTCTLTDDTGTTNPGAHCCIQGKSECEQKGYTCLSICTGRTSVNYACDNGFVCCGAITTGTNTCMNNGYDCLSACGSRASVSLNCEYGLVCCGKTECQQKGYSCLSNCAGRTGVNYACDNGLVCCGAPSGGTGTSDGSGAPSYGPPININTSCTNAPDAVWTLDCIFPLLDSFLLWGILLGSSVAVFVIIIAGIRFIASGGDPKGVEQARKAFIYAIAALFLMYLSFFIINVIGHVTGATCVTVNPKDGFSFNMCPRK